MSDFTIWGFFNSRDDAVKIVCPYVSKEYLAEYPKDARMGAYKQIQSALPFLTLADMVEFLVGSTAETQLGLWTEWVKVADLSGYSLKAILKQIAEMRPEIASIIFNAWVGVADLDYDLIDYNAKTKVLSPVIRRVAIQAWLAKNEPRHTLENYSRDDLRKAFGKDARDIQQVIAASCYRIGHPAFQSQLVRIG